MKKSWSEYYWGVINVIMAFAMVLCIYLASFSFLLFMNISELEGWKYAAYTPTSAQMVFFLFLYLMLLILIGILLKFIFCPMLNSSGKYWHDEIKKRRAAEAGL